MKKAGNTTKISGEERIHDATDMIKKLFESTPKPNIVNKDVINEAKKVVVDEAKSEFNTIVNQILGIELKAGQSVNVSEKSDNNTQREEEKTPEITNEHLTYFSEFRRESEGKKTDETSFVIRNQLNAILAELKSLKSSSDELENVFKDVAIDTPPEKPGIYHLTFFEGFLKLVIKMRNKVEDGVTYAKLFRSRKQEKSYHSMAKKQGTSFTLHHDRAVATQTG